MPPAAIAVVRVSGAHAADAVRALAGRLPPPRHASLADLTDTTGAPLDRALTMFSAQSDRDILFTPTMVGGRRSKAVFGRMDPDAALNALLRGQTLAAAAQYGHALAGWVLMRPGAVPPRDPAAPYDLRDEPD